MTTIALPLLQVAGGQDVANHLFDCSVYKSSGSSRLGWRLSDGALHCALPGNKSCDYSVRVLAEELAYNRALKQFKMFIVEKPLDPNYKVPPADL